MIVNEGKITSSSFFNSNALKAISNAALPLETAMLYFLLTNFESLFSNSLTNFPSEPIHPVSIHFLKYFCSLPINNGTFTGIFFLS